MASNFYTIRNDCNNVITINLEDISYIESLRRTHFPSAIEYETFGDNAIPVQFPYLKVVMKNGNSFEVSFKDERNRDITFDELNTALKTFKK